MKKTLIILAIIILFLASAKNDKKSVIIPDDSIRLRIISNSNSKEDINQKLALKKIIEDYLFSVITSAKTKKSANDIIVNNIDEINNLIKQNLGNTNYKMEYGKNYFPSKIYKNVVYNKGIYDSLVITIGEGKGHNWWCVLFPPLCLLEDNNNTKDVDYELYISRIINNYN